MTEAILVSSSKGGSGGICVLDLLTGSSICPQFKDCIADKNCLVMAGKSSSSFSGHGSCGDYIFASQSQKPLIHSWQWNKTQVLDHYHLQEILTAMACDPSGSFLVGGSKKGYIYMWNIFTGEFIRSIQCHFKAITCILFDLQSSFLITSADDGMIRVWEWDQLVDIPITYTRRSENFSPYRSWSSHALAVKDLALMGSIGVLRVASCSSDRSVIIHDVHSNTIVLKVMLPQALESICLNHMEDHMFVGSSSGPIYVIDLTVQAIAISAAKAKVISTSASILSKSTAEEQSVVSLEGHSKAVTSLQVSMNDLTLVSASSDGSIRMWSIWTRQCMHEVKPFPGGVPITNLLVITKPDALTFVVQKPSLHPLTHLSKYKDDNKAAAIAKILPNVYLGSNQHESRDEERLVDADYVLRTSHADVPLHKPTQLKRKYDIDMHENPAFDVGAAMDGNVYFSGSSDDVVPDNQQSVKASKAKRYCDDKPISNVTTSKPSHTGGQSPGIHTVVAQPKQTTKTMSEETSIVSDKQDVQATSSKSSKKQKVKSFRSST